MYNDYSDTFIFAIGGIYVSSYILSFVLYSLFTFLVFVENGNTKEKEEKNKVCKLCCYTCFSQIDNSSKSSLKNKCIFPCLKIILNYFFSFINGLIQCFCQIFRCDEEDQNFDKYYCRSPYEEEVQEEDGTISKYICLKLKKISNSINDFINSDTHKKVLSYSLSYILLQFITIVFEVKYQNLQNEKKYYIIQNKIYSFSKNITGYYVLSNGKNNNNNNDNIDNIDNTNNNIIEKSNIYKLFDIYSIITFLVTFYLFLYLTISLSNIIKFLRKKKESPTDEINRDLNVEYSKDIFNGNIAIIIVCGFYSLIFSIIYYFNSENKIFKNKIIYMFPYLMNKFYHFTMIYFIMNYSEQKDRYQLVKGSIILSLYYILWNEIKDIFINSVSLESLYWTQFIISLLLILSLSIYWLIKNIANFRIICSNILSYLCYICLYLTCFFGWGMNENSIDKINHCVENRILCCKKK